MKRSVQICSVAAISIFFLAFAVPSSSQPRSAPSALKASQLKHRPPQNWIRHYLPDDRYKIAGGVWKVVSTEFDRFYYPAWAPEMLRQKADTVIGFSSPEEAEEAGYLPAAYPMKKGLYGLTAAEIFAARQRETIPAVKRNSRIILADHRSSVVLPKGWRYITLPTQRKETKNGRITYKLGLLSPSNGQPGVVFAFANKSPGTIPEFFMDPKVIADMHVELKLQAIQEGLSPEEVNLREFKSTKLGGLNAVSFSAASPEIQVLDGLEGQVILSAKGEKIYIMSSALPLNDKMYDLISKSFQPR